MRRRTPPRGAGSWGANLRPDRFLRRMRGSTTAVTLFLLFASQPCLAQGGFGAGLTSPNDTGAAHVRRGTVITIDSVTMNFTCHGNTGDRFYWIARDTRFQMGRSNASFFDLRTGQPVQVMSHRSGNLEIADLVLL